MKQCTECLKWFNNEQQRCHECCVQLSENEASSEDANTGYFAIGNNELNVDTVNEGDVVSYRGMEHPIKFGHNAKSNEKSKAIGFITHNGTSYLVAVNGRLLGGVTLVERNNQHCK